MNLRLLLSTPALALLACGGAPQPKAQSPESNDTSTTSERAPLDAKKISYAMRGNEDDYRKCFMQQMGSRGAVTLGFSVSTEGRVEQAEVEWSSLGKKSVGQCLVDRLSEQLFGEQQSPAQGRWTFVFNLTDPIDDEEREELLEAAAEADENSFQLLPESEGDIDAAHLDEIVQVNYPLFAHCYRDSIKRRGESRGLLRLMLRIREDGRPTEVDDAGSVLPDPYAVDCIAEAFYAMQFPEPSGGPVVIKYGLDFE